MFEIILIGVMCAIAIAACYFGWRVDHREPTDEEKMSQDTDA